MNWPLLQNSLLVAGTTTALATGFGLVAALWLATLEARWRNVFLALAVVTLALPPFLVTNCWISLLGESGTLRRWLPFRIYSPGGTIWILSLMLWPLSLVAVLSAWRRLEAAQFECDPAMTGFALLRWLLLPVTRGELALAAVLTFVLALNDFAVPAILQTKVLPDEMWVRFNTQFDALGALKLAAPLVIAPVMLLAWASRRTISWPRIQGAVSASVFRRQLGSPWQIGCGMMVIPLCVLSVGLPLAQIALARRTWVELPGAVNAGVGALWNSFWFAALAATCVIGLALVPAFQHESPQVTERPGGKSFLRVFSGFFASLHLSLLWLPFFVPGVLIGIALIHLFNRPVLAALYQSAGIVILALVIRYSALGWATVRHAVASVDSHLMDAARLEGASRSQVFRFAVWPQIAPQVLAAWYVVYLLCLWDVESMVLIVPPGGETLALRIFNLLHYGYAAHVNALCLVLLGLAVLPLVLWSAWEWGRQINTRPQHPSTGDTSCTNIQTTTPRSGPSGWNLVRPCMWLLGALCLVSGCSPASHQAESQLHSRIFEHAEIIGSRGVNAGQFNKPRSLALDRDDNLFVVDMTGRVQKFSPSGRFLLQWQMPQTDLGKPKGMCRDAEGNIIVLEPHYQRVNHFSPEGGLVAQWGCRGTNEGCFMLPRSVAVNSLGEILVSEYAGSERVQVFRLGDEGRGARDEEPSPQPPLPSDGKGEGQPGAPLYPGEQRRNDAAERTGSGRPHVLWPRLITFIGRPGTGPGEFNRAEGLGVDAADRIYVADSCNHRIQVFSPDGTFVREFGTPGSRLGELSYPYDVRVDAGGLICVCEFGSSRIQVFDDQGQPVEIVGGPGAAPGQFNNPWALAFDSKGNLYVADALNHRVQKLIRRSGTLAHRRRDHAPRGPHQVSQ